MNVIRKMFERGLSMYYISLKYNNIYNKIIKYQTYMLTMHKMLVKLL